MLQKQLLVATLFAAALLGQELSSQQLSGTWQAKVNGAVVCTLRLQGGEQISGTLNDCSLNFDEKGELVAPDTVSSGTSPLRNVKLQKNILSFEVEEEGDSVKMELKVVAKDRAELRVINGPPEIKPVPFQKT
jgi:hypothetical protein